ncbi:hypothetical protein SAMN05216266_11618 [Amycolatopsis marina]|uniref:Secreted protein n=1 Tax=Amycolatopsis marina TaxID=490629 RepID=A0A1I1BVE6_9PSEU|nr:hypothetical protein SAMN05216266_11618 [Amycolatopsis marina]
MSTINHSTGPSRLFRAISTAAIATAIAATAAAPASASVTDKLEGDCSIWALTDRVDRSTNTYGSGRVTCKHDNYFAIIIEAKLYKNGSLRKVHRETCGGPPVSSCGVSTGTVPGSRGTWKTSVTAWAKIGKEYKYTASHSKTW